MGPSYTNTGTGTDHLKIIKSYHIQKTQVIIQNEITPFLLAKTEMLIFIYSFFLFLKIILICSVRS